MGALVPFRHRGSGRQSREVEHLRDARDELAALVAEGETLAPDLVYLADRALRAEAAGQTARLELLEIRRLAVRMDARMAVARDEMHRLAPCPDGETLRHIGHGRSA